MLRFLQGGSKAAKYILGGFLVILAASMVTYLIPGFMSDAGITKSSVVASVAGTEISTDQVQKAVANVLRQQHYPEQLAPFVMPRVVQQLIQQEELRYEAHRLGLEVSDQEVRDDLQNGQYKATFFPDGKWIGQEEYEKLLTSSGTTVAEFERAQKNLLLIQKLISTVSASAAVAPAEIEKAYREKNTKVKFEYAVLKLEDVNKDIKPTDTDLKAFYQTNLARYQNSIPEKRQIRYFVLADKDAESKITVSPAEIARYYGTNMNDYQLPDRVKVRHILISIPAPGPDGKTDPKAADAARAKAEDVLKQVKAGGNFAELAKKYSQDPGSAASGGELGWVVKGQTVAEFEKVAFAQNPGQISDLVKTSYGFHIIQTEEKETAHVRPLAEVKDKIEQTLKGQKAASLIEDRDRKAETTADQNGLDKAAQQSGATVIASNPVARGDQLPGVGAAPDLMNAIFTADVKTPPQSQRFGQGYVVFQVTKIDPARTPAFDEIKDRVAADFKSQKSTELLLKKLQQLADRAHAEHDLAKAAKEAGATVKTSELVARTSQVPELGSMSGPLNAAFSLKSGEISGPINMGQQGVVLEVTDRQEPSTDGPQFAKERDSLQEQLKNEKQQQAVEIFLSSLDNRLKKEGKLKENKDTLDRLTKSRG